MGCASAMLAMLMWSQIGLIEHAGTRIQRLSGLNGPGSTVTSTDENTIDGFTQKVRSVYAELAGEGGC